MKISSRKTFFDGGFQQQSIPKKCLWLILATVTLLVCFYSSTIVMSVIYPLDSAILTF